MAVRPELAGATQTVSTTFASTNNNVVAALRRRAPLPGRAEPLPVLSAGRRNERAPHREGGQRRGDGAEVRGRRQPRQGARFTLSCQVSGGALTLQLDGATKATASDASPLAPGSAGFAMGGSTGGAASHRADDFSASRPVARRERPAGAPGAPRLDTSRRRCRLLPATSPMRDFVSRRAPCRTK